MAARMSELSPPASSQATPLPLTPRPAWMWKPRSKLVDAEKAASLSTLLKIRGIGAKQWRRRFVFVDRDSICYGSEAGTKEKVVPFESIQSANFEPKASLLGQKAPREFAEFGWYLHVEGRHLMWCAESREAANEWVHFVQALLAHMRFLRAPTAAPAMTPELLDGQQTSTGPALSAAASRVPFDREEPNQLPPSRQPQATASDLVPDPLRDSSAVAPAATRAQTMNSDGGAVRDVVSDRDDADDGSSSGTDTYFADAPAPHPGDHATQDESEEDDEALGSTSRRDRRASSSASSAALASNSSDGTDLLSASSGDTEGGDSDANDDVEVDAIDRRGGGPKRGDTEEISSQDDGTVSAEERYAQYFLPVAQNTHSHIAFRIPLLSAHFKGGDTPESVVFSRSLEKIGKRDNVQPRDLVLTPSFLYLFTRKHVGSSTQVRCIPTDQIVGAVVSTTDAAEMAVLIPSFHDVVLRVTPQNSRIGGTEAQVKQQLIAHLFKIHHSRGTGRRFVYREVPSVRAVVRRSMEDKHQPLASTPEDITHAASSAALYPTFRVNVDSVVYWSSVVRQIRADRKPVLHIVVVTDGAVYVVQDNLSKIVRRSSLDTISALYYDADSQTILLQCVQAPDILFSVQKDTDFDGLLRLIPALARQTFGRHVRTMASKQLYAHARLAPTDPTRAGIAEAGTAAAARADAPKPKAGHHTLSRQLKTLWKAGMRKENKYESHATKASTLVAPTAEDEDDGDGDPLHTHRHRDGSKASANAEQALYAMYRFVEETVLDYDDELHLLHASPSSPTSDWDSLALHQRFGPPPASVGTVLLSTPCYLFDTKEVNAVSKSGTHDNAARRLARSGANCGLCVTTLGMLILGKGVGLACSTTSSPSASVQARAGSGSLTAPGGKASRLLRGATALTTTGGPAPGGTNRAEGEPASAAAVPALDAHIETQLVWANIIALVRCRVGQSPLMAIMTDPSEPQDFLLELPSDQCMLDVMTAAAQSYATTRTTKVANISTFGGSLPLFAAPRASNVARALKKTLFDPFPTVSLRHTAASYKSDALRMAVVPEVADVCRRFGDNTVFFSGVAWRIRSATLRHENGVIEEDPGPRLCRRNNNLYKSYILLLTNCALYHCAKGGFEVMRRTSLLDVEAVYVSTSDPDTIMLTIPSEYDMYFRIEGRGREFLERLQEAYIEWTNYDWYRPHEHQGSHRLADYFVPVHRVASVAVHGRLTKPPTFNALQANRSPVSVRTKTLRWHERHLEVALAHFERALEVGRTGMSRGSHRGAKTATAKRGLREPSGQRRASLLAAVAKRRGSDSAGASGPRALNWVEVREQLALAQSFLYFTQRRCFRAGVRGDEYAAMNRAQVYLSQYAKLQGVVKALEGVAVAADMEAYERLLNEASGYPELKVLIAEQSAHFGVFRRKQQAVKAVLVLAMQTTNEYLMDPEAGTVSFLQSLPEVARLMGHAIACDVDHRTMRVLTFYVDVLAQREQLSRCLASPRGQLWLLASSGSDVGEWARPMRQTLVHVVARGLFLPTATTTTLAASTPQVTKMPNREEKDGNADTHNVQGEAGVVGLSARSGTSLPSSPSPLACGVLYLLAHNQQGWAVTAFACGSEDAAAGDTAAQACVKERLALAASPTHTRTDKALAALAASVTAHQQHQDWSEAVVRRLHRQCRALKRQLPTDHVALALVKDILTWLSDSLAVRHAALARRAQQAQREVHAQRFYEAETARQAALEARAEAMRVQREEAAHQRRRDAFYATWRRRVQRLHEDMRQAIGDGHHDTDKVRLVGRQCAQLQVELEQSVQAYVTNHQDGDQKRKPAEPAEKTQLVAQIAEVSETARDYLIRETHGGVNPYACHKTTSTSAAISGRPSTIVSESGPKQSPSGTTTGTTEGESASAGALPSKADDSPPPLPSELEEAIAVCDADSVARYVQQHEQEMTESVVAQLRSRWQASVQQQLWVDDLRRGLRAATTLRSPVLLRWHLSAATARGYDDDMVQKATALHEALLSVAPSAAEQTAVWDRFTEDCNKQEETTGTTPVPFDSFADSARSSEADSDIVLDESLEGEEATQPCTDSGLAATSTDSSSTCDDDRLTSGEEDDKDEDSEAMDAGEPSPTATLSERQEDVITLLMVFVQTRFPELEWPSVSALVEETQIVSGQPREGAAAVAGGGATLVSVCDALTSTLRDFLLYPGNALRGEPDDAACMLECAADNPHLANLIFCWMQVWACGLRPEGLIRKAPRFATDVIERVAARRGRDGGLLSPHANHLMGLFLKANRLQTVRGPASDFAFLAFMMQEREMEAVLLETSRLEEKDKMKLMDEGAPLRHLSILGNLLSLARLCSAVVMPYDVRQPSQLHHLLVSAANAPTVAPASPPPPSPPLPPTREASAATSATAAPSQSSPTTVPAAPTSAAKPQTAVSAVSRQQEASQQARAKTLETCTGELKGAVHALSQYFTHELTSCTPTPSSNATLAVSASSLQKLFDEHEHPALIPVLSQAVEPALLALLEAGFQSHYQLVRTRSLWDLLESFSQHLRESSRSLVGVEIVGAVELVGALTDEDGRYKTHLVALSEMERGRVCLRIFLRQCLNRRCLVEAIEALFPTEEEDAEWGSEDGIWAFYDRSTCLLAPRSDPHVDRIYAILRALSRFPFSTAVDRALW